VRASWFKLKNNSFDRNAVGSNTASSTACSTDDGNDPGTAIGTAPSTGAAYRKIKVEIHRKI
jgi:hypothetical protein